MIGGQCSRLLISSLLCSRVEDTTLADTLTPHSSFLIGPAAVARRARCTLMTQSDRQSNQVVDRRSDIGMGRAFIQQCIQTVRPSIALVTLSLTTPFCTAFHRSVLSRLSDIQIRHSRIITKRHHLKSWECDATCPQLWKAQVNRPIENQAESSPPYSDKMCNEMISSFLI